MRPNRLLLNVLLLGLLALACKKEEIIGENESLIGKWEVFDVEGPLSSLNLGVIYMWDSNGNMTTEKGTIKNTGPYTISNDTITWNLNDSDFVYIYKFESSNLLIEPLNSGQLLTLKRL